MCDRRAGSPGTAAGSTPPSDGRSHCDGECDGSHFHQHEDVKGTKRGRHYDEEVAGHDYLGVIVDEGEPALLGVWRAHRSATAQILRHRARGHPFGANENLTTHASEKLTTR